MSDNATLDLVRRVRQEMEEKKNEEVVMLKGSSFDPVKKIASILERNRPRFVPKYSRRNESMWGNDTFFYSQNSGDHKRNHENMYSGHIIYSLLEYLGTLINTGTQYDYYLEIVAASEEQDVLDRMVLFRVKQSLLNDEKRHLEDEELFQELKEPVEHLAHKLAITLHQKMVASMYAYRRGIPEKDEIELRGYFPKSKKENYEVAGRNLRPMNPETVIAANALYQDLKGLEDRISRINSSFDLILLLASKYYQKRIADVETSSKVQRVLNGRKNMENTFYKVLAYYNLAMMGDKLK